LLVIGQLQIAQGQHLLICKLLDRQLAGGKF